MSRFEIGFITDGEPFDGAAPEERALGGSETACVQMARALADRGHRVRVYCRCPRPGLYHGVRYLDRASLVRDAGRVRFEVLVVSRFFSALDLPLQAGLRVLWNHDILDRPEILKNRIDLLDLCLVLSDFHAQGYRKALPECGKLLDLTRNGLDLSLIKEAYANKRVKPGKVMYVSRPERGLELLLESIWPRLKQMRPDLFLNLCGYQVNTSDLPLSLKNQYQRIDKLISESEDVVHLGSLAKLQYYRELAECEYLLYPCVFPEISCIAVLEAQALGVPIITSDYFALRESVLTDEFKVPGDPGSKEYIRNYLARAKTLFAEPELTHNLAGKARRTVLQRYDWATIAREWEALFLDRLEKRNSRDYEGMITSLLLQGDTMLAESANQASIKIPDEGPTPEDPDEKGLLQGIASYLAEINEDEAPRPCVAVVSSDQGATIKALKDMDLPCRFTQLTPESENDMAFDAIILRDVLERSLDPASMLAWAETCCKPLGWLIICTACGAWPLISPGHMSRLHDLGLRELEEMLPGRKIKTSYLPRGLVGKGAYRYFAGRLLAMAPAQGPPPSGYDTAAKLLRTRPAPARLTREVRHAGLF